ncbi:hypothetical protein LGQ03_12635 [Loktanella sp. TSTF-M6]|uniref:Peptidase M23 n=1 Tax=Loktanella gaetbuli TaxID=2881335 RepID=A0ABS8BWH2_9RHOB|nr:MULTISPECIES: peptidase M23 [Loktanella]MCB5200088.1 hypothetical protein [Loktanella gaetbuli]
MKHLSLTIAAILAASPALAHGGAHIHPHGMEIPLSLMGGIIALAAYLAWRRM